MAQFKLFRTKRYETTVEAANASHALLLAPDVEGKAWQLVDDRVEKEVAGLDNARQRPGEPARRKLG